jgi:Ohr subfamily peroxiredoxin
MEILYKARVTSIGGRDGSVKSSDGVLELALARPGAAEGGTGTNPEQLFAAGYAACFHSALKRVSAEHKVSVKDSKVTVDVGLGRNDKGAFGLDVDILVDLPNATEEEAEKVVKAAHQVCPYSNATRGNIDVRLAASAGDKQPVAVG